MFLVRSAFWLTVAFIALHPRDVDLGQTAAAISGQAMAAGRQIVAEQVLGSQCSFIGCEPSVPNSPATPAPVLKTALAASQHSPSVDPAMQGSPSVQAAPVPRPRPAWMS